VTTSSIHYPQNYRAARVGHSNTVHLVYCPGDTRSTVNTMCGSGLNTIGTKKSYRTAHYTSDPVTCKKCLKHINVSPIQAETVDAQLVRSAYAARTTQAGYELPLTINQQQVIDFLVENSFVYAEDLIAKLPLMSTINAMLAVGLLEFNPEDAQYEMSGILQYCDYTRAKYTQKDSIHDIDTDAIIAREWQIAMME